jgi:hypothetical protein
LTGTSGHAGTLGGGNYFVQLDSSGGGVETFAPNNPGDANGDGMVNINDLSKVLTNYDKTGMLWADGDFSGDGTVSITDLSVVLTNYDTTYSAGGIRAVPEPASLALAAVGLLAMFAYRRRISG